MEGDAMAMASRTPQSTSDVGRYPVEWRALDVIIARHLKGHALAGLPYTGYAPCACGGTARYILGGAEKQPIWRCLDCGTLHSGDSPISWD
jgi:hypothetical protein